MRWKTYAALFVLVIFAISAVGVTAGTGEQEETKNPEGTVRVTGQAVMNVEPDRAEMNVVVETEGDGPEIQEKNARKTEEVLQAIKDQGIPEDNIETRDVRFSPVTERDPETGSRETTGYKASHSLEVQMDDVEMVGAVMDAAVEAGAERVDRINFGLSDQQKELYRDELITSAVENGYAKASAAAGAAGVELDGVLEIEVRESRDRFRATPDVAEEAMERDDAPTEIHVGELELEAEVKLAYYLDQ